jgi:hypothetical protein
VQPADGVDEQVETLFDCRACCGVRVRRKAAVSMAFSINTQRSAATPQASARSCRSSETQITRS